eukprot:XP_020395609.1 mucin-2-like [Zea mays]
MTPAAELHHPTVVSPLSVTSGKIGPTLKLASLFSCYGTCLFPRNRGGELPLNPPAAGFSPRDGRFTPFPVCADAVSPPALPAALTLALSRPRIADKPAPPVSHPISLAAHGFNAITADHALFSSTPAHAAQRSSAPLRPRLLWSCPCTAPPHRAVPSQPLCTIYAVAVHLTGVHLTPLLPFPQAPIKGPPRAPPCPAPASTTLLLLPELNRTSSAAPPSALTRNTAPLPPITTRTSPATTPAAELRHPIVVSPLSVTSSKIGPTLKLTSLFSCYGTYPFPKNRVTGGESSLNPPAAGFSPRDGRFTPLPHLR